MLFTCLIRPNGRVQLNWSYPPNITLMPLPPRCPELNPVKNVGQFMRDNWLSKLIFNSDNDIVDDCCFAWSKLVEQP
jgi:hypothetical protein